MTVPRITRRTEELRGVNPDHIPFDDLFARQRPMVLKGLARDWPLVRHGLSSPLEAMRYLTGFYQGQPIVGYTGAPEINGRFHYDETATGLNFGAERTRLDTFLDRIAAHFDDPQPPAFYIGSTDVDAYLPGLRADNDLKLNHPAFAAEPPLVSIWMGNHTIASAHWDVSNNIACCVVGRRRFTLFPPDQIDNLYPGPLEPTPGGQVVSMVDFDAPDLGRFPRFADAIAAGEIAELEAGDVLIYPALWWHHVEAFGAFNAMINYWWNAAPAFMDMPMNTLLHAMLSLRDRPESEKRAWRVLFDYYIFGPTDRPTAHLPEAAHGNLAPLDEAKARRLRAMLLNKLNR